MEAGNPDLETPGRFMVPVSLNGKPQWALIGTGCWRTLVKAARCAFSPKFLKIKCVHRNVKKYRTEHVSLDIGLGFTCRVRVIPHGDCRILIGRDFPTSVL